MWGRYVNSKIGFLKYDGYPNFTRLLHESLLKREFDWHDSLLLNASFQRLLMTRFRFTPSLLSIPEVSARLLPDCALLSSNLIWSAFMRGNACGHCPEDCCLQRFAIKCSRYENFTEMTCDCVWQCWPGHQAGSDLQQLRHPL